MEEKKHTPKYTAEFRERGVRLYREHRSDYTSDSAAEVVLHSDQGSQFTSREWQAFLRQHDLEPSMSRRGNCHDNAVAESFFQLLKRERVRRRTYPTRDAARQDVFEYIELFYNPKRKHTNNGMLSPVDFEIRQQKLNEAGV